MTKAEAIELLSNDAFKLCMLQLRDPLFEACYKALNMAIKALEQQPKRGYWLEAKEEDPCWYRCSECGRLYDLDENYCPNCGARMEGNEE